LIEEVIEIACLLRFLLLFLLFTCGNIHLLRELIGKLIGLTGASWWVVAQVIFWLLMSAILYFGICQTKELRKLSLSLVIFWLDWFFPEDLKSILLEGFNAWTLVGWECLSDVTELVEVSWLIEGSGGLWLIEATTTELIESAHASLELVNLWHLRLHAIAKVVCTWEHRVVSHVWISHRGSRRHHVVIAVSPVRHICCELPRILSHLCHILHYLV
jgi:hypothetical protein